MQSPNGEIVEDGRLLATAVAWINIRHGIVCPLRDSAIVMCGVPLLSFDIYGGVKGYT